MQEKTQGNGKTRISKHALIVFLLWAFAPLAWFLIWQDKKYHSWFPKLLWVNGIIFGILFFTQSVIAIPKLNELYSYLHIEVPGYFHPVVITLVLLFAAAQIYAGMQLEKQVKKEHKLVEKFLLPIIVIFAIDGLLALSTGALTALTPAAFVKPQVEHIYEVLYPGPQPTITVSPTPVEQFSPIPSSVAPKPQTR